MSSNEPEELNEIVISPGSDSKRSSLDRQIRRSPSEKISRPPRRKSSRDLDGTENRRLLHANSEPSSRLEVNFDLMQHCCSILASNSH